MEVDFPETSSDSSNETIILSNDGNRSTATELDELLKKYLGDDICKTVNTKKLTTEDSFSEHIIPTLISDSEEDSEVKSRETNERPDYVQTLSTESPPTQNPSERTSFGPDSITATTSPYVNITQEHDYDIDELPDFSVPKKLKTTETKEYKFNVENGSCSQVYKNFPKQSSSNTDEFTARTSVNNSPKDVFDVDDLPDFSASIKSKKFESHEFRLDSRSGSSSSQDLVRKNSSKENNKIEKEIIKQQKLREKELKKEEERKNKALKEALASHYRNLKPENCLKFIKVHIDEDISKKEFSEDVFNELRNNGISFNIGSESNSKITWTRQIDSHILDTNGELINTSKGMSIEEVLVIVECGDFVDHVHNNTLRVFVESMSTILAGKKMILAIYGLEKYYRYRKNKKTQEMTAEITGKSYKSNKEKRTFENMPVVSRRTVEYALTELQLFNSISHRLIETSKDMAQLVFQLTKSIAQVPYKLQKQEKLMQSKWYMSEDNKNCIRVDKNGNGLSRLWKQMITTFPLASLETAVAISAVYPTPLRLMQEYDRIASENDGEKLLQDIPIRRTAGPISTMRKIGPELSKKFYHLFTSLDPNKIL